MRTNFIYFNEEIVMNRRHAQANHNVLTWLKWITLNKTSDSEQYPPNFQISQLMTHQKVIPRMWLLPQKFRASDRANDYTKVLHIEIWDCDQALQNFVPRTALPPTRKSIKQCWNFLNFPAALKALFNRSQSWINHHPLTLWMDKLKMCSDQITQQWKLLIHRKEMKMMFLRSEFLS